MKQKQKHKTELNSNRKGQARKRLEELIEESRGYLTLGITLALAGFMVLGTVDVAHVAQNTTLDSVVTQGSLTIENVPSSIDFGSGAPGATLTGNTGNGASNKIQVNDTRGTLAGWTTDGVLTGNWVQASDATVQIAASQTKWFPGSGTLTNVTGNSGEVDKGANDVALDTAKNLMKTNGSGDNGAGAYKIENVPLNFALPSNAQTGTYSATLQMTIS